MFKSKKYKIEFDWHFGRHFVEVKTGWFGKWKVLTDSKGVKWFESVRDAEVYIEKQK